MGGWWSDLEHWCAAGSLRRLLPRRRFLRRRVVVERDSPAAPRFPGPGPVGRRVGLLVWDLPRPGPAKQSGPFSTDRSFNNIQVRGILPDLCAWNTNAFCVGPVFHDRSMLSPNLEVKKTHRGARKLGPSLGCGAQPLGPFLLRNNTNGRSRHLVDVQAFNYCCASYTNKLADSTRVPFYTQAV